MATNGMEKDKGPKGSPAKGQQIKTIKSYQEDYQPYFVLDPKKGINLKCWGGTEKEK